MQLPQPLTFLHITLSSGYVLGAPCVHQVHFQTVSLQHIMEGDPVNSGGLHHHGADSTILEPAGYFFERARPGTKLADGLRVALGRYRYEVALVAHVNAGRVPMDDVQARIVPAQTLLDFS